MWKIAFPEHIPNKSAKYGIKILKLYADKGYTWNVIVCGGKSKDSDIKIVEKKLSSLWDVFLDEGRALYRDKYYSVGLPIVWDTERLI